MKMLSSFSKETIQVGFSTARTFCFRFPQAQRLVSTPPFERERQNLK
jgi:hypothetical protein